MSFELKPKGNAGQRLQRIIVKLVRAAADDLDTGDDGLSRLDVHDVRKRIKRARALLEVGAPRSVRKHAGDDLRAAAASLNQLRDAEVRRATVERIVTKSSSAPRAGWASELDARFARAEVEARAELGGKDLQTAQHHVDRARHAIDSGPWQLGGSRLMAAISDSYARTQRARERASLDQRIEVFHDLRKHVKALRHQVAVIAPADPDRIATLVAQADRADELLGDDHDRAMVLLTLVELPNDEPARLALAALAEPLQDSRKAFREEALDITGSMLAESPGQIERIFSKTWRALRGS